MTRERAVVLAWLSAVASLALTSCATPSASAPPSAQCPADDAAPSIAESRRLSAGPTGGANAWLEVNVTWPAPAHGDYRLLFDGVELPIVRAKSLGPNSEGERGAMDPTEGRLIGRDSRAKPTPNGYQDLVSVRVPPGTTGGQHQLVVKTCRAVVSESLTIDVARSPAPVITNLRSVQGEWPVLFIEGKDLSDAEEIVLVGEDDAVSTVANVTVIDNEHVRAPLDKRGRYEVFVRTKTGGLGGGPPTGVITVR